MSYRPLRRLKLRALLGAAALCVTANGIAADHAPAAPERDGADDARNLRLFIVYGITGNESEAGFAGLHATSVQGVQWRDAVLYNQFDWRPALAGSTLTRRDTAFVSAGPLSRSWLTLGDRYRDAALLLPVRFAGLDVRVGGPSPLRPQDRVTTGAAMSAGELDVRAGSVEIRPFDATARLARFGDLAPAVAPWSDAAVAAPMLALAPHVVDGIEVARALPQGSDEYEYGFGAARTDTPDGSAQYGGPAFVAAHRIGVTGELTLGAHAVASGNRMAAGLDGAVGLGELGAIDTGAGIAHDAGTSGPMAVWRYALARGPLDVRARYRFMPADVVSLDTPDDTRDAVRDLATRVSYTLPGAGVLSLEGRRAAFVQYGPQTSLMLGYAVAGSRQVGVEGRVGYASGSEQAGTADAWLAGVTLRIALDGDNSTAIGCTAPETLTPAHGCASR
jgi:hypothetical protein